MDCQQMCGSGRARYQQTAVHRAPRARCSPRPASTTARSTRATGLLYYTLIIQSHHISYILTSFITADLIIQGTIIPSNKTTCCWVQWQEHFFSIWCQYKASTIPCPTTIWPYPSCSLNNRIVEERMRYLPRASIAYIQLLMSLQKYIERATFFVALFWFRKITTQHHYRTV